MSKIHHAGLPLDQAKKAVILIHGRGASADSILSLRSVLKMDSCAILAPEATQRSWYPFSFMAPDQQNLPALENSLEIIQQTWDQLIDAGISPENIFLIGFSQGACLSLEFAARNAKKLGGVIAFTGGLIGETLAPTKYKGDFAETPIFIGSSERDFHVPLPRILESIEILKKMGANVSSLFFKDADHTIRKEEIEWVNQHML
jgi:phospholipase/carboxylesterase